MTSKKHYEGQLAKPSLPKLKTNPEYQDLGVKELIRALTLRDERETKEFLNQVSIGIDLLFDLYQINRAGHTNGSEFFLLALCLARDHVPFFARSQAKRGPKERRNEALLLEVDVALRRLAGDASDKKALEFLVANTQPWKSLGSHRNADWVEDRARRRRERRKDPVFRNFPSWMNRMSESSGEDLYVVLTKMRHTLGVLVSPAAEKQR